MTEQLLGRLPPRDSALLADRNFAVFSVAWTAQQHHCGMLFRITEERARKIAGPFLPPAGSERRIERLRACATFGLPPVCGPCHFCVAHPVLDLKGWLIRDQVRREAVP